MPPPQGVVKMGWLAEIAKEEQGEHKEKIFHTTQGKRSSSSAQKRGMVLCSMSLTFAGDKWEMGGRSVWGVERADGFCDFVEL